MDSAHVRGEDDRVFCFQQLSASETVDDFFFRRLLGKQAGNGVCPSMPGIPLPINYQNELVKHWRNWFFKASDFQNSHLQLGKGFVMAQNKFFAVTATITVKIKQKGRQWGGSRQQGDLL